MIMSRKVVFAPFMMSMVRSLLQPIETVTSMLVMRSESDKQFSFQIATERGCKTAAGRDFKRAVDGTVSLIHKQLRITPTISNAP